MEDYERISTPLSDKPKYIKHLRVAILENLSAFCVKIVLYETEDVLLKAIRVPMQLLGHHMSPTSIQEYIKKEVESFCDVTEYDEQEVMQEIITTWVYNADMVKYLTAPKTKQRPPNVTKAVTLQENVSRDDKAAVKLPKAIVVSKNPLEVFVGNLLDKYYK